MVNLERRNLCNSRGRIDLFIVTHEIIGVRPIGLRKQRLNFQCNLIETLLRNNVIWKWITEEAPVRGSASSRRIVDHAFQHLPPKWVGPDNLGHSRYGCAEITIPICQRRNRLKLVINVLGFAELLEVDEEECLVPAYRTTYGEAVIISSGARSGIGFAGLEW